MKEKIYIPIRISEEILTDEIAKKLAENKDKKILLEILDEDIEILKLNIDIVKILKKNKIIKVKQLANKTKTKLKDIGLLGYQISEI